MMDSRYDQWLVVILTFLTISVLHANAVYYDEYELSNYCGSTISLSCRDDALSRAGVLKFTSYPTRSCTVNVTVDNSDDFCQGWEYYSIYFNVKSLSLLSQHSIQIYETNPSRSSSEVLVKTLNGGYQSSSYSPRSYGQLKSGFSTKPLLTITFNVTGGYGSTSPPYLVLDYNVVHDEYSDLDMHCNSLNGYIRRDLMCETGDRVNCPSSYVTGDYNYVYSTDQSSSYCYTAPNSTESANTTTLCISGDFKQFCKQAPTASLLYQTGTDATQDVYVLISGNCAMKYKIGISPAGTQVLDPTLVTDGKPNPVDLREIYPGYDLFNQTLPITFAYVSSATGPVYLSSSANSTTASACRFPGTDPKEPCDGSIWPTAPLAGVLSTSAPTPNNTTVVPRDQFYVFVSATNQLCLSNTGRPTTALPATQCRNLTYDLWNSETQNEIVTVTAIQYVNHDSNPGLIMFGTDWAGVPLIAFGDVLTTPAFHPPTGPVLFNTFGGSFPMSTYTNNMNC